jgi:hypothetical protein
MRAAAAAFLESLGEPTRRHEAQRPFADEDERRNWHYIPRERNGLSLAHADVHQANAAYRLLATALSLSGLATTTAIVALEDVLDRIEGGHRHRHHRDYSVTVFGEPDVDHADHDDDHADPWGWRFEGHHVSINVTVVDGVVSASPLFLGANPAELLGPTGTPVTRPLAAEEDLALTLFGAMTPDQRDDAVLSDQAPDDILTTAAPRLTDEGVLPEALGVRLGTLAGDAATLARQLVRLYLDRLTPDVADAWWRDLEPTWGEIHLAVAGRAGHRLPQYYRLLGSRLLVEYDNTQNDANHVHTVVRDPEGDFGDDLLRRHREAHH